MVGFTRHGHAKKSALSVILEALEALCMKTLARLRLLRLASDEEAEQMVLTQQSVLKTAQSAAKFMSDLDVQVYRRHGAPFIAASPDEVDLEVAQKMLKVQQSPSQTMAALRGLSDLAKRHSNVERYVKETVKKGATSAGRDCALSRAGQSRKEDATPYRPKVCVPWGFSPITFFSLEWRRLVTFFPGLLRSEMSPRRKKQPR